MTHRYYAVRTGVDRYDLRQTKYAPNLRRGKEHPHDLMAAGFTAEGLRDVCERHAFDADLSALERTP